MLVVLVLFALILPLARPAGAEPALIKHRDLTLRGELFRPDGPGPFGPVVALHGFGGIYRRGDERIDARHDDSAQRLVADGFVVLLPDTFNSRGSCEICTLKDRPITAKDRGGDIAAAIGWLGAKAYVDVNHLRTRSTITESHSVCM